MRVSWSVLLSKALLFPCLTPTSHGVSVYPRVLDRQIEQKWFSLKGDRYVPSHMKQ